MVSASTPLAEQLLGAIVAGSDRRRQPLGIEAGIGAQRARRREVGDQHVDRPVGPGLQDELAVELQRRAEQHGQHADLGQQPRHRLGIVVPLQDLVEHRPELDDAAAHVERADLEGHDMVVAGKAEFAEFRFVTHGHIQKFPPDQSLSAARMPGVRKDCGNEVEFRSARDRHWRLPPDQAPRHQASTAFCACSRFSASSNTTECGPSITSSVTSSPRCAGRQCMNSASGFACFISAALT